MSPVVCIILWWTFWNENSLYFGWNKAGYFYKVDMDNLETVLQCLNGMLMGLTGFIWPSNSLRLMCVKWVSHRLFSCTILCIFVTVRCLDSPLDFEKAKDKNVGPELDELLTHIAKTGKTEYVKERLLSTISTTLFTMKIFTCASIFSLFTFQTVIDNY